MRALFSHLAGEKWHSLTIGGLLCSLLVVSCVASHAQTTGTIVGTVRDNTGDAIPGATVTVTDMNKGTVVKFTTDATGSYNAPLLIPGTYSVGVEKQGFEKSLQSGVMVQTASVQRVDAAMQIGSVTQTVNVTTQAPLVETDSADVGQVIASGEPQALPLNGRDYFQLAMLVPAVTPGTPTSALSGQSSNVPRGDSDFNAFGMSDGANSMLVDGIDNQEYTFGAGILEPDLEAVKEFKVLTGYFSAQYGRGAGVILVSTNSGTNQFHGNLFEFVRNNAVDAKLYFTQPGVSSPFRRNQFGGALGGPVVIPRLYNGHDRTFFFIETGFERQLLAAATVDTVPTAQTRAGNFQGYQTASGTPITIYDPSTTQLNPAYNPSQPVSASNPQYLRTAFPNNIIPPGRMNQVGLNIASIYPLPNGPGFTNNYTSEVANILSDNSGSARVDQQITDKNKLFGRWIYETLYLNTPIGGAGVATAMPTPAAVRSKFDLGPFVSGGQVTTLVDAGLAIDDSQVITPTLVNEFLTGYARLNPHTLQSDYGLNPSTALGIDGVNINQATSGLPILTVANYTGINDGASYFPLNNIETVLQWQDTLFWTHRNQNISFGSRWVLREASPFVQANRGSISFATNFTNNPATNAGGDGLATMLLGVPISATRGITPYRSYYHLGEYGTFIQDDIKLSRRLTVNLGARWDIFAPPRSLNNRMANFDPVGLQLIYADQNGTNEHTNIQTRWNNVAPRVGFEWDLRGDGKTVLNAGYGIAYFPAMAAYSANGQLGLNVPFIFSQSYTEPTNPIASQYAALPTIAQPFTTPVTVQPVGTAALNTLAPNVIGWELSNKTPLGESYTLNIQRQVTPSMMLEVGYGGSQGRQLVNGLNINEVEPGTGSNASRRLIQPLSNLTSILIYRQRARSNWNGLMVKVNQRTSHGLGFLFSYSYGKALDCTDPQSVTFTCAASYGLSSYDVKHRAVGSAIWDMPGSKLTGPVGLLLGGWQLTGIVTGSTGIPFTPSLNAGVNNGAPSWPNQIGSGKLANRSIEKWFNTSDFVAPPANTYGDMRANPLFGPGSFSVDTSLVKQTKLYESLALQLRFEAYNLLNHPFFGLPNAVIGGTSAGIVSSTANNLITDGGDNRNLEAAIKFVF
jgi:Carboxypeptidase regulatory-like domain/TonB-dependent Receptor Plug Domain